MPQNREMANNKQLKKKGSKVNISKKTQRNRRSSSYNSSELSEELVGIPLSESITEMIQREVANIMKTTNFKREIALELKRLEQSHSDELDTDFVRMEDLKNAVNEIISRDSIQVALDSNAKLFAEDIQILKKRLVLVEAKLDALQTRISDLEQLVHQKHNAHIKQVVRTMMKEFGHELIIGDTDKSPATQLFNRATQQINRDYITDTNGKQPSDYKEKDSPTNQQGPAKLSDGKKRLYSKITKEYDQKIPVVTLQARVSASDTNLGFELTSPPRSHVSPKVSHGSLIAEARKQHKQRVAEQQLLEVNALAIKKSAFSLYLNERNDTYPINIRKTCPTAPVREAQTVEYHPRGQFQYKTYNKNNWTRSGNAN